jgi:hypothetical protein
MKATAAQAAMLACALEIERNEPVEAARLFAAVLAEDAANNAAAT